MFGFLEILIIKNCNEEKIKYILKNYREDKITKLQYRAIENDLITLSNCEVN